MSRQEILDSTREGSVERQLFEQINLDQLPRHIAVIMDGNGRWAKQRGLPRIEGHRAGIESVREAVETCARLDIQVLTLYAFSVENWKRPRSEIDVLMKLLKQYLRLELSTLMKHDIRFAVIGRLSNLPEDVVEELNDGVKQTNKNRGLLFNIALNYSGRAEIVDACQSIVDAAIANSEKPAINESFFSNHLYTNGMPDPDLLIRTSGELRVSNFLLWQIAYSEIWVTDTLWPDFRKRELFKAIINYQKRDRRYGGITPPTCSTA